MERKIDFTIGRDDFGVTVYVPWNCTNNCKFCSSKQSYNEIKSDFEKVKKQLFAIRNSIVEIVTFTGGEPSVNIEMLKELVSIVDNKVVFINTTLPKVNAEKFIDFVNKTDCVKSVSISRHCDSFEEDLNMLNRIADDETIRKIKKPVRINVVEFEEGSFTSERIERLVERWSRIRKDNLESVILNLRCNYELQSKETLHEMEESPVINMLTEKFFYHHHTFCNVCDTCVFFKMGKDKKREFAIHYHRGLSKTSIKFGNIIEVNDLIITQDGNICYDWDNKTEGIERLLFLLKITKVN